LHTHPIISSLLLPTLLGLSALSAGCSDGGENNPAGSGGGGGSGAGGTGGAGIEWGACPADFAKACAAVPLPLDHAKAGGETLPIFVSRYPAKSGTAKAQLWLLQGGPGGSGDVFKQVIETFFASALPDVDFYVLEHRGVGESSRLGCPVEEDPKSPEGVTITQDEWPACIAALKAKWGDKLAHFTTTADAEDLAQLIERTREPNKKVFVYGGSYGTTRALRFLQLYPDMVDGVILDSVVSPGVQFLSQYDTQYDPVAQKLSKLCAADAVCGAKMGMDPWAKISALIPKFEAGHCDALGMSGQILRQFLPLFVQVRALRTHLFPIVYRLDRCDAGDVEVLNHYVQTLLAQFQQGGGSAAPRDSIALQNHVALSEIWEEPAPSVMELQQRCDDALLCPGLGPSVGPLYDIWPRYPHDQYVNKWPTSKTPILAMNGELDPQTPIEKAKAVADNLAAPHQTFVSVPFSPHGAAFESPVKTANKPTCGTQMIMSFMADPTAALDTSCLGDLKPVAFTEDPAIVQALFGTSDMWENGQPIIAPKSPKIDWTRVVAMIRERVRP
jgi:pimeloyl-ACP methyl ester carboxylesterase